MQKPNYKGPSQIIHGPHTVERKPVKRSENVQQEFYNYKQAGQVMGKSPEAARAYVNKGELPAYKRGKIVLIARTDLLDFIMNYKPNRKSKKIAG